MNRRRCGIMLVEMLIAVILVAAAMVLASRLTVEVFNQHRELPVKEAAILRSQAAIAELRKLVWNASAMSLINGGVSVTVGGETTDWRRPGVKFRIDGPVLIADTGDGEVRCVSQLLLANGGRP